MAQPGSSGVTAPAHVWEGLLVSLAVTAIAATLGSVAAAGAKDFYALLAKPSWAPSPQVFGPVWTLLYILMAVAAWLVWRSAGWRAAKRPLVLYLVQLALNALWTWIFFQWRSGAWAFADIIALDIMLLVMLIHFWRVRAATGILLVPYLAWALFASALTAAVWQRNPSLL
jgi:benzodiazapine receptor